MKLTLHSFPDSVIRLQCEGDITQADFLTNPNPLPALLGPVGYGHKVMVDMEKTTFIDSAGIGWLMLAHKGFREAGGMLVLYALPPMVNHVLKLLKLTSVMHLADDEAGALALVKGAQS